MNTNMGSYGGRTTSPKTAAQGAPSKSKPGSNFASTGPLGNTYQSNNSTHGKALKAGGGQANNSS